MKIYLSPCRMEEQLAASVESDIITVNGIALDFGQLNDGDSLHESAINSQWIAGNVTRIDGEIFLTLRLPHGANAPRTTRYPSAFTDPMTITSGQVPLPPYDAEEIA